MSIFLTLGKTRWVVRFQKSLQLLFLLNTFWRSFLAFRIWWYTGLSLYPRSFNQIFNSFKHLYKKNQLLSKFFKAQYLATRNILWWKIFAILCSCKFKAVLFARFWRGFFCNIFFSQTECWLSEKKYYHVFSRIFLPDMFIKTAFAKIWVL